MNAPAIFVPKEDSKLPDSYTLTVHYLDGRPSESFECASHKLIEHSKVPVAEGGFPDPETGGRYVLEVLPVNLLELTLKTDTYELIPMSGVKRVSFDSNWTKIIEINKKMKAEQALKRKELAN